MTTVSSPSAGRVIGLAAVPDPVFSGAMVGPGIAVDPVREPNEAVSPVDGMVVSLHPHAFVVVDDEGHGVLTHLGIDTVQLNGEGFELLVAKGDTVSRGQAVVRWNPAAMEAAGRSPVCPVIALDARPGATQERGHGELSLGRGRSSRPEDTLFRLGDRRRVRCRQRCEASASATVWRSARSGTWARRFWSRRRSRSRPGGRRSRTGAGAAGRGGGGRRSDRPGQSGRR